MVIIKNTSKIAYTAFLKNGRHNHVTLAPGITEVDDDVIEDLRKELKELFDGKALELMNEVSKTTNEVKPIKALTDLSAEKAKEVVKLTFDKKLLNEFLKNESRDSIRSEIMNQLESLKTKKGA